MSNQLYLPVFSSAKKNNQGLERTFYCTGLSDMSLKHEHFPQKYLDRPDQSKIAIVGLGYVMLPLAIEFAKKYRVLGFDIKAVRIAVVQSEFLKFNYVRFKHPGGVIFDTKTHISRDIVDAKLSKGASWLA